MSDRLTPDREAEIAAHLKSTTNWSLGNLAARDLLAELAAVRAERDLARRKVASLKAEQDRDDAEYAEVIAERDRALKTIAAMEGEHYAAVHHDYRTSRDLPRTQTAEETTA